MRKAVSSIALAVLLLPLLAGAAVASEGGENNLFAGDMGNAIWTLVIFVLVVVVLGKFAWGPLLGTLQQRERFIRESLEKAKADREAAEARLQEYTEKLHQARSEASAIVEEGRRDAEVVRRKIEEESRETAEKMLERAKREIDLAKQSAIKDVYAAGARFATEAASRIVGRELRPEDHARLIAESIDKLDGLESN